MEVVAWDLAVEFARLKYPVRVITTSLPDQHECFLQDGVKVVPLSNTPSGRYSRTWWQASRRYFSEHCMGTTLGVLSVSAAAFGILPLKKQFPDVPFIMQAHGTSWGEVISKWRSKRVRSILSSIKNLVWLPKDIFAYRKFDSVIAVGERVRMDLTRAPLRWVLAEEKVHLISNGIDTKVFYPSYEARINLRKFLDISETVPVVISASRLHAQKGVDQGVKAFAKFLESNPDAVYLIAGDGPEREYLQALVHDLGVEGNVRFLGALERFELAEYLCAADVFLFLTKRVEGLPLNVLEALACGLPCIVSDYLMIPFAAQVELVLPDDQEMIVKFLQKHLNSPRQVKKISLLPSPLSLKNAASSYLGELDLSHGGAK
ncbi:glycosyltransferase family 4 protein [Salinicola salarius]|uniref:glycosyltransferase family 4 protein n=1 Tax=Salinicola salarius TaxID=430457 RepID=UPI00142D55DF|nr:glycosyltransferase family 4 protein [Salinicola salarius]